MALPFDNQLSEIADSMGISLYQRFSISEAAVFLHCQIEEVSNLIDQRKIDYIQVTHTQISFFGFQLLQYLLGAVSNNLSSSTDIMDRILRPKEVQEITGLSRTTLWRMENKSDFPRRVSLGVGSVGWRESEVRQWLANRKVV